MRGRKAERRCRERESPHGREEVYCKGHKTGLRFTVKTGLSIGTWRCRTKAKDLVGSHRRSQSSFHFLARQAGDQGL